MAQVRTGNKELDPEVVKQLPCSQWDIAGDYLHHSDMANAELLYDLEKMLPAISADDFEIGWTGYVMAKASPFGRFGWCRDISGRTIICAGEWWGFTRYYNGDIMIWYHQSDRRLPLTLSSDEIAATVRTAVEKHLAA